MRGNFVRSNVPGTRTGTNVASASANVQTTVWAPFGLTACLANAEEIFRSQNWKPRNPSQEAFLSMVFGDAKKVLGTIPENELRCITADSADPINEFFRKYGSGKVQLQPFQDRNSVGFGAITKVLVPWACPGTRTSLLGVDQNTYAAAKLKRGIEFMEADGVGTVLKILGKEGHCNAYMTPIQPGFARSTQDVITLVSFCRDITRRLRSVRSHYEGVIFPMVDLEKQPDLSWLLELEIVTPTRPMPMFVRQAIQLLAFKMNHLGAAFRVIFWINERASHLQAARR